MQSHIWPLWDYRRKYQLVSWSGRSDGNLPELVELPISQYYHPGDSTCKYCTNSTFLDFTQYSSESQKPWQSSNFIKSLTQFKTVHILTFYTPQTEVEDLEPLLQDLVNTHFIRDLRQAWPNLRQIVVLDQTLSSVYFDHQSGWRPRTKPLWKGTYLRRWWMMVSIS